MQTAKGTLQTSHVINCAGLYADRVAAMLEERVDVRIVPFRGEYYTIRPESHHLVSGLIYPVPDPRFPFLGVHYTPQYTRIRRSRPQRGVGVQPGKATARAT